MRTSSLVATPHYYCSRTLSQIPSQVLKAMQSESMRATTPPFMYNGAHTTESLQVVADDVTAIPLTKKSADFELPLRTSHVRYIEITDTLSKSYDAPRYQFQRTKADLPQEYNEDTDTLSDDSDRHYFSSIEEEIIESCDPKQAAGRWRGKGVSKAEYAESGQNYVFRPVSNKRGQDRKDEEESEEPDPGRSSGDGEDGDGKRNPDLAMNAGQRPVDPKDYYGYLFEADKKPTKTLDAMLRGIARYIVSHYLAHKR
jgi:hypothetical protein